MTPESPMGACSHCGYLNWVEVSFEGPKNRRRHRCAECGGEVAKPEAAPLKLSPARTLRFTRFGGVTRRDTAKGAA
jgi:hypothetical protein